MTGISQGVGNFSEQVWGVSMSVVTHTGTHVCARPAATTVSQFGRLAPSSGQMMRRSAASNR